MMVLGFTGGALGGHLGGWRHRNSFPTTSMQLQCMIEMAQIAERGGIDMMFLADGNGVRQMDKPTLFAANSPSDRPAVFEPVTLFSAVAQHTSRIGLVATATTSYEEPFTIARKFASLDHLSGGRAGWNLVTTQYVEDSKNFGRDEHFGREDRYERARESLDVVRALWDSWASDAFLQDKSTGRYLDPDRVRLTNHRGKHFAVKGPLNVARTPQGQPVVFMAGQSDAGKELAAYGGEGLFGTASNKAEAQAEYADIKGRMKKYGRPTDALRILPALSVFVGRTAAEADALFDELQALISPALAVSYLSKVAGVDLTGAADRRPDAAAPGREPGRHGDRPLGAGHGGARRPQRARHLRARAADDGRQHGEGRSGPGRRHDGGLVPQQGLRRLHALHAGRAAQPARLRRAGGARAAPPRPAPTRLSRADPARQHGPGPSRRSVPSACRREGELTVSRPRA